MRVRRILMWVVVAFLVYAIFASPDQAADIFRSAFGTLVDGLSAVGEFFDSLLTG